MGGLGEGKGQKMAKKKKIPSIKGEFRSIPTSPHPTYYLRSAPRGGLFTSRIDQVDGCLPEKSLPSLGGGGTSPRLHPLCLRGD